MLAVMALERHGIDAGSRTGRRDGGRGRASARSPSPSSPSRAFTSSPRPAARRRSDYLKSLGAAEIIDRAELSGPAKPLGKERWAAGVDSAGSHTLANLLSMTKYGGAIAACGLAQGLDLPASVAPFILRGISLLGIDSVYCPQAIRREAWKRLAADLDRKKLAAMTTEIPLARVAEVGPEILAGKVRGRTLVRISG